MIWPPLLFNLCVGLLLAGYLLRAVRRFERRADAIMAKLDQRHAEYLAKIDQEYAEEARKYDIARDEIKDSMRTKVDHVISELVVKLSGRPTKVELSRLPWWAQVAFAARCARRVLPLIEHYRPDALRSRWSAVGTALSAAEHAAASADASAATRARVGAIAEAAVLAIGADDGTRACAAAVVAVFSAAAAATVPDFSANVHVYSEEVYNATYYVTRAACDIRTTRAIRRDFETVRDLAKANNWTENTPVPPSVFGPLWPEGAPAGWPELEKAATEMATCAE